MFENKRRHCTLKVPWNLRNQPYIPRKPVQWFIVWKFFAKCFFFIEKQFHFHLEIYKYQKNLNVLKEIAKYHPNLPQFRIFAGFYFDKDKHFFLIINLHSKSLKIWRDACIKKKKLFDFINKTLAFQIRNKHFENVLEFYFFIGSFFKRTFKICSIIFNQPFLHLFIKEINIYIHLSLFNISKHSFYVKT